MEEGEEGESEAGEPFPGCASRGQSGGHTRKQTEKQNKKFINKKITFLAIRGTRISVIYCSLS